ncbi:polypyrimidine tract-binding protein homolog 1-like [Oryza brachyantha]|uniref:RRM domain-containing protein n=1 Tax=Oryza brachyantha TaxID=4533 RepID=J3L1Y9_ORYBR|nr:polypyrimidine tract-binding protein homolog 1-like [Oryza brachyantha]
MASGQPQFRYTQPPSKVIHLRNLPWDCTEEELVELGSPFGKVVNTKCNVGANRNQAFIEFADQNQAIAMISYFASSAEPAQVRGKNVYLQYSNRQEIVNSKSSGEAAGNVLLVSMEGVLPDAVSIDVLNLVFSTFGFVQKIATFEKASGYQALIQFCDTETASSAKAALDGRCIPSYLLPELDVPCTLRINYSAHTVLNVKFQSHRSRDYTNPYLPVAPSAIDGSGPDGKKQEAESNVLLASVENMQYVVTIDVLHEVFSAFGFVQKIAIFEKNSGFQALIQYPDIQTAVAAKEALEGHSIYEGGYCKLHLTFSRHTDLNVKVNNERGRDYTGGNTAPASNQPSILGPQPVQYTGAYNSVPSSTTGAVVPPGTTLTPPGAPSHPYTSNESLPQTPVVPSVGAPGYTSQGILQGPPGVPPAQFSGYGTPQFPPGSAQAQMHHHSVPGSQQMRVNHQPPGGSHMFMQYPGDGSRPVQDAPGPQAMPFHGHGGQHLPPGYGGQPQFQQGPRPPMPQQFTMYGDQQFPPGMGPQMMMPLAGQGGGQQHPFAPLRPYNSH